MTEELLEIHQETVSKEREDNQLLLDAETLRTFYKSPTHELVNGILEQWEKSALQELGQMDRPEPHALMAAHAKWRNIRQCRVRIASEIENVLTSAETILEERGITLEEWRLKTQ